MTQSETQSDNNFPWKVLSLRLTIFVTDGPNFDPTQLWVDAIGEVPEEEQNRPRSGEFARVGQVGGMRLRLLGQPGRVDWFVETNIEEHLDNAEPLTVSAVPWGPARELFSGVAHASLSDVEMSVSRLAFGAIVVQPVEDVRSGYLALNNLLASVTVDPDNSSDFSYQINHRRQSQVIPELSVNRLSKWAVMSQGNIRLHLSIERGGQTTARQAATDIFAHAVRLELDVNTEPGEQNVIPQNNLNSIFEELVNLGVEIAGQGDIA